MRRFLHSFLIGAVTVAQVSISSAIPAQPSTSSDPPAPAAASANLPPMPALPSGESTIMGGAIRKVDPVLDRFTLDIFGQRPLRIEFDERTQLFRNGVKIPLRELGPADHASVQTALDGSHVFAESIHILSQAPEGECQGVVRSFDSGSGTLSIDSGLSPKPVNLYVSGETSIVRTGQPGFKAARSGLTDLVQGTLIQVTFTPDLHGRSVARHITVLAVPGSEFIFGGTISFLNMSSGSLVLLDSRDGKSYQIYFNRYRFPSATKLHVGQNVTVTASFEGSRYEASSIATN
ncbi:MAG TPA: hypothetical protein VF730_01770 [Terracidiphilus sp.]